MNYSVPHYLDASVASKMFSKESGWEEIHKYVKENWSFHCWITEFVYYEILNVLKLKWVREKIDKERYLRGIFVFNAWIREELIKVDDDFNAKEGKNYLDVREIVNRYDIDYSDALQIYTVLNGRWKRSTLDCKTVFVSADKKLIEAARDHGLRTWHYGKEPPPTE